MNLIWKLLRRHISAGQLAGFFLANLLGMLTVLLSVQFYEDIIPAFGGEDSFIKNTYIILSKQIAASSSLRCEAQTFTDAEISEIEEQRFTRSVGRFTASQYQVYASLSMGGSQMGTSMFFESVPDDFVDVEWPPLREGEVPIILPRTYLALYNFGFAQSQSLPKLSEGVVSMIQLDLRLRGEGGAERDEAVLQCQAYRCSARLLVGDGLAQLAECLLLSADNRAAGVGKGAVEIEYRKSCFHLFCFSCR